MEAKQGSPPLVSTVLTALLTPGLIFISVSKQLYNFINLVACLKASILARPRPY